MLSAILSLAAPAIATSVLGPASFLAMNPMITSAIGGGIGKLLEGGNQQDALQAAALGGLGSFLGGKLAGGQNIAGGSMPGFATAGGEALPSAMTGIGGTTQGVMGAAPDAGFMAGLTRPEAIGAGLGAAIAPMPKFRPEKEEEVEMPRGMPIKNTSIFHCIWNLNVHY